MTAALAFTAVVIGGFLLMHMVMSLVFRPRCTCLFEPRAAIGTETDEDGAMWRVYPRCRMHGRQQRTRMHEETTSREMVV